MIKNGIEQNVVPTTTEQNLAAAKCEETFPKACLLFRRLEHANNRGTGEHAYDLLEQHFNEKEFGNLYLTEDSPYERKRLEERRSP